MSNLYIKNLFEQKVNLVTNKSNFIDLFGEDWCTNNFNALGWWFGEDKIVYNGCDNIDVITKTKTFSDIKKVIKKMGYKYEHDISGKCVMFFKNSLV